MPPVNLPMGFPGFPGFLPGPITGPNVGPFGPAGPSAGIFPTNVKTGDVVNVTGPFAGKFQGQVVVRFAGAGPQAISMLGPFGGSVVVPPGAETGACTIEVDGRTVHSATCVITPSSSRAPEHKGFQSYKNFGTKLPVNGDVGGVSMKWIFGVALAAGLLWVLFNE